MHHPGAEESVPPSRDGSAACQKSHVADKVALCLRDIASMVELREVVLIPVDLNVMKTECILTLGTLK